MLKKLFIAALLAPWFTVFQWAAFAQVPVGALMPLQLAAVSTPNFAHVQTCTGVQGSGSASPVTITCGSAVGAHHLLTLCGANANNTTALGVTFNNESFTQGIATGTFSQNGLTSTLSCWYVLSAAGGESSISASSSHYFYGAVTLDEFSYSGTISLDAATSAVAQGTSITATCNSLTPTANGDLIFAFASAQNTLSAGTGFTAGSSSPFPSLQEYKVQTTAASIAPTASSSYSNTAWGCVAMAFK